MRSFEDILKEFEEFFDMSEDKKKGNMKGSQNSGKIKGRDINGTLELDFMDSIRGVTKQI